ncbi:hypothetical protein BDR03DRAFT_1088748, partial [Suillus americanus]
IWPKYITSNLFGLIIASSPLLSFHHSVNRVSWLKSNRATTATKSSYKLVTLASTIQSLPIRFRCHIKLATQSLAAGHFERTQSCLAGKPRGSPRLF